MAVFRVHKLDNYTKVNNHLVRDDISLKAKGMMLILLSLPNDWKYSVSGLSAICKEARNTINNILNELEEKEYLERTRIYEGRQIKEWKYDIYEVPKSLYLKYEDIKNEDIKSVDIKNEAQLIKDILSKEELNTKELKNNSSNIYDFIEVNFSRTLNPIELEIIKTWEDTELTRYAIKQAVLNLKYNIKYIDKILYQYKLKNITSVAQAQEDEVNYKIQTEKKYKKKETFEEMLDRKLRESGEE